MLEKKLKHATNVSRLPLTSAPPLERQLEALKDLSDALGAPVVFLFRLS